MLLLPSSEAKAAGGTLTRANAGWDPSNGTFGTLSPRRTELVALLLDGLPALDSSQHDRFELIVTPI